MVREGQGPGSGLAAEEWEGAAEERDPVGARAEEAVLEEEAVPVARVCGEPEAADPAPREGREAVDQEVADPAAGQAGVAAREAGALEQVLVEAAQVRVWAVLAAVREESEELESAAAQVLEGAEGLQGEAVRVAEV